MITDRKLDKNSLLLLAAVSVILVGLVSYYFSTINPVRREYVDKQTVKLESQSSSSDVDAIEKDLNDTELDNLDQELGDIDKELNQAY